MKFIGKTNRGNVRKNNEDSLYISSGNKKFFIVADGMGGHLAGEEASLMATSTISEELEKKDFSSLDNLEEGLVDAINLANKKIFEKSKADENFRGMGTTLSILYFFDGYIVFANIGDSRIYEFKDSSLKLLTRDDSFVNYLVEIGDITSEEAAHHPKKNVLTKALGTSEKIEFNIFSKKIAGDEKYLLCSDGLSNMVEENELEKALKCDDVEKSGQLLVKEALDNGGLDNITLIIIDTKQVDNDR
ncbi:Stp1/IreP family PP2C-type Ser/Thr phosphatase [Peptoniphilus sp. GNH]|nr:putative serine/threonine phosphatase stp [Clostridiales bacterium KA00134]UHR02983.1 Stp1/IreP family PP2C-type Ser/Thr phosphatase [Peptoniphilus sp. GNH]